MSSQDVDKGYFGQNTAQTNTSEANTRFFAAQQMMNLMSTATLCRVDSITNKGDLSPIGTMSCTPLVNMLDGRGQPFKHGSVNKIIYCRLQGGKSAVILDPKVGDIGLVVFCDRDTSAVRKTRSQSNPGSARRNDFADGVWVMTVLADTPDTSHLRFKDDGTIVAAFGKFMAVIAQSYIQVKMDGGNHITITKDDISTSKDPSTWTIEPDPHPGSDS